MNLLLLLNQSVRLLFASLLINFDPELIVSVPFGPFQQSNLLLADNFLSLCYALPHLYYRFVFLCNPLSLLF